MPRNPLFLLPALVLFAACDKDDDDGSCPAVPPANTRDISDLSMLAVGNYWVYDRYQYDAAGAETPVGISDSLAVVGDTVAGGSTYFVLQGQADLMGHPYRQYLRDSADCIVSLGGEVEFRLSTLGQVFDVDSVTPDIGIVEKVISPVLVQHSVPAGTWDCYMTTALTDCPGYPERTYRRFRAVGVGIIELENVFLVSGAGFRHKLVRYHVQ